MSDIRYKSYVSYSVKYRIWSDGSLIILQLTYSSPLSVSQDIPLLKWGKCKGIGLLYVLTYNIPFRV